MKFKRFLIDEAVRIVGRVELQGMSPTYTSFAKKLGEITQRDLDNLEIILDRTFKALGFEIEFSRHFLDRVTDERNKKAITFDELQSLFNKTYKKHGQEFQKLKPDTEGVIDDLQTDINVPFVVKWDSKTKMLELLSKTVLRKKNFMTSTKTYKV